MGIGQYKRSTSQDQQVEMKKSGGRSGVGEKEEGREKKLWGRA